MAKLSQFGIAVTLLGAVIAFMGLFPGVIGLEGVSGIGVLQTLVILSGFSVLISGAYIYVQSSFFPGVRHNLAQQIAIRLSMTGLVLATASGLADILGFGSHPPMPGDRPFLGPYQTAGLIGGFVVASLGVVIFILFGPHDTPEG